MRTTWPAGLLGPVVGWIRLSIAIPLLAAMLSAASGAWANPVMWSILAGCAAILHAALRRTRCRRAVYAAVNLVYASLLLVWALFWKSLAGDWWAVLTGLTGGLTLLGWDGLTRWGLARAAVDDPGDHSASVNIDIGTLWGFAEASTPTVLGLKDGTHVVLRPGYRYAWWLRADPKEPCELILPIDNGEDFSAN